METSTFTRRKRRKKVVHQCPNPLFEKWLAAWQEEAVVNGWKVQHTYAKALKSLKRYPLPLQSGKEAKVLEHFGDKLCKMLDDKLLEHKNSIAFESDQLPGAVPSRSSKYTAIVPKQVKNDAVGLTDQPTKKRRNAPRSTKYIPVPRSGPYALLITLLKLETEKDQTSVQKKDLIDSAQPLCDASFTLPNPGSFYTAWSIMGTLLKKGLVIKSGHPPMFGLTDSGRALAITLVETDVAFAKEAEISKDVISKRSVIESTISNRVKDKYAIDVENTTVNSKGNKDIREIPNISASHICISEPEIHPSTSTLHQAVSNTQSDTIIFNPGTFDVILCVDTCEVSTGLSKSYKLAMLSELINFGIKHDVRKLHVGDFLWIAKPRIESRILGDKELVLDYIVERKRMDDLAHSIKDGRFHEQKFRLKNCGIKKPIYLIEEYISNQYFGIPEASLNQAIINTQIVDGFLVKRTKDVKASVRYLTMMTRYLQSMYNQKMLTSCRKGGNFNNNAPFSFMFFNEFNSSAMKNKQLTIREMFAKHLLQLKSLSVDKAIAIVEKYSTPAKLLQAYDMCESSAEKEKLLEDIKFGRNQRRIGAVVSNIICNLYCRERFSEVKSL